MPVATSDRATTYDPKSRSLSTFSFHPRQVILQGLLVMVFLLFSGQGRFSFQSARIGDESAMTGAIYGSTVEDTVEGQAINLGWCAIVMLLVVTQIENVTALAVRSPLLSSLAVLAVASAFWSQSPALSLRRGFFLVLSTLLAYYFTAKYEPEQQMRILTIVGSIGALGSIAMALLLPLYGIDHMTEHAGAWKGLYIHKNICAEAMLLLLVPLLGLRRGAWTLFSTLYALTLIFVVVMSQSRTGWVVGISLVVITLVLRGVASFRTQDRGLLYLIGLLFAVACVLALTMDSGALLSLLGRDATLSGRTKIWAAVIDAGRVHPLLGYGYNAFWSGIQGASANVVLAAGWAVPHAHNGLLEIWLQLGAVGVALLLFSLLLATRDIATCLRPGRPAFVDWYIGTILLVVLFSLTEPFLVVDRSMSWVLYVTACLGLRGAAQQMRLKDQLVSVL